jgi:hypothetical protein
MQAPALSFAIALLVSTLAILSIGFVVASVVPTARFAQPVGALIFYPMMALSGLFVPVEALPADCNRREAAADDLCRVVVARRVDRALMARAPWRRRRPGDIGAVFVALSAKVFSLGVIPANQFGKLGV